MALQVWLPLNGNLNNQGLSNLSLTNNGATPDTAGKIGNCMKLSYDINTGYSPNINSGSLSIGGWFKFNKSEIQTRLSTLTIDSRRTTPTGNLIGNHNYSGIGIIWTANNMNSSGGIFNSMNIFGHIRSNTLSRSTGNYVVQFDTWTHLFITFDINTRILTFYVNGQYYSQVSIGDANDIPTTSIRLNVGWVYGGNGPGSSIPFRSNDVRIYDHCLSPKEVKEISKGLVLHYKLDEMASSIVYDCSGYGRNGTITGQSISINNISPRYNHNLLATNTSDWSVITNSGFSLPDGPTTICFWSKPTVSATENTSRVQIDFGYFRYFTYINYPYLIHNTDYKYKYVNYWSDGNWHFVTGVYDGTNLYVYVDGADVSPSTTTTTGNYQNDLIIRLMGNNLSDFRIYSTALSADDIKELYDTSAIIYNDGTIAAREFKEINTASSELHPIPIDNLNYITFNSDGSYTCSGKTWFHGDYIPINPSGKTYYYDIEYSNVSGNLFYVGFERYDANKDSGQNNGTRYIINNSNAASRVRLTGIIDLATALTGNPTAFVKLRILNDWNNSGNTSYKGTIHYISLKEVATKTVSEVTKTGIFEGDTFIEDKDASISHTGNVVGNQIIEI